EAAVVDSLVVTWPGETKQLLRNLPADTVLVLREEDARGTKGSPYPPGPAFRPVPSPLPFAHAQPAVNDFKRQPLLVNPLSFAGPCLVKGDVNGDGRADLYAGGGPGQPGVLYLGGAGGTFTARPTPAFQTDQESDDVDALFFDANGDRFPDLYVCSGGYHGYAPDDPRLQDRLYLNDGKGNFTKSPNALPAMPVSTSCARAEDVNGDGHPDLFVGGRVVPGRYPEMPRSYLLLNDGKGRFRDATVALAPGLERPGLVTDAAWADLDGDGGNELVVVGEWMPVHVWKKGNGKLTEATDAYFAKPYRGWWNKLLAGDLNGDGKADLLVGNMGLNTQCKASPQEPAELYYKDFDDNGAVDPILCLYSGSKSYPYASRDELLDQISLMRTRFPDYKRYADATLKDIFTPEELKGAARLSADHLATTFFRSTPGGKLQEAQLPPEAQFAPVFAMTTLDYNRDGHPDLLLGGNVNRARLRLGNADANYGLLLRGDGRGNFVAVPQRQSGLQLRGDVRCILNLDGNLLFGLNGQPVAAYKTKQP
ncbi:MAG: VCBS repeat-containing protein, partial [Cytophagales bacterium]|nr:VCBS repeat-containing protein [Cytophagales bacterium]